MWKCHVWDIVKILGSSHGMYPIGTLFNFRELLAVGTCYAMHSLYSFIKCWEINFNKSSNKNY